MAELALDAHAEVDSTILAKYDSEHNHSFLSGELKLSEYSQCFEDATFAANHANDTITLAPTGDGVFVFDANYNPIGTEASPFIGTIVFNTSANEFNIQSYDSIFNYVSDSVTMIKQGAASIPININRIGDVGAEISPLFAKHVKGSESGNTYSWTINLDSASSHSYSGVIYEMYNGAKINLTFTDNSTHTPVRDANNNIVSGSIINNQKDSTNYGILCGKIVGGSQLQATYTNTNDDAVTFIGTQAAYCGGLIGEINASTFELLTGSSSAKVDFQTAKNDVGFICGHAESSTITLPTGYTFQGAIDGNNYVGGIAGYCKNTTVNYATTTGAITLSSCNIKNGTSTGGVFGYYECDTYTNDILLNRTYSLESCTVTGTALSGGIAGEYKPTYTNAVSIDLDKYAIGNSTTLNTGTTAGGLFGKYTAVGNVTITDTDTTNAHFVPPSSTIAYGGIIGEYVNTDYANTLTLDGFTVNNLSCTSSGNVGGIIRTLTGSTYVSVDDVSVTNATVSNAVVFGGIVSTLDSDNEGSFIDVIGNYTLSLASGTTYKGGAIAGSFKTGVIRLAGLTDISGAQAENGYAQLVYENDETLVYAKGNGSDYVAAVAEVIDPDTNEVITAAVPASGWTLKRNANTTASDLGQWGEVVRLFKVNDKYKNAEDAGILTVAGNKVTIAQGAIALTDTVSFAKCALNMQLNDSNDHGALCFADKTTYPKSVLLGAAITVSGEIDLSGTGLLGFMRDGGNEKYLGESNNTFSNSVEFFTGSVTGSDDAEIKLAAGEAYGCDANGIVLTSGSTGGKIYISNGYGHDAQGLFAFAKGAEITSLKVSGSINVERNAGSKHLYAGALFGAMTNGADLSGVNIITTINTTRTDDAKFYIGGVSGVFDGTDTTSTDGYTLTIDTSSSMKPAINLYGVIECDSDYTKNNTYVGGVLGLLKGSTSTKYAVSIKSSEVSPAINIDDNVADAELSYLGGMIGRIAKNSTNERTVNIDTVTMTGANVETKAKYAGGLLGAMWERTNLTVDGLTITGSTVNHNYSGTGSKQSGLVFMGSGKWDINSLTIQATSDNTPINTTFNSTDTAPASFGLIVNEAYSGDDGLYINLKNRGYVLNGVTVPTSSTDGTYYVDEIAADTKNNSKNDGNILIGGDGTGIININMNTITNDVEGTKTKITDIDSNNVENGTGTYQNRLALGNLIGNQNSRYYYNLDAMMNSEHTKTDGEKFLLWSVSQYAASNINSNFIGAITNITDINLSGLSYYPIPGGTVTLPTSSTVTFGFKAIHDYEDKTISPDSWKRFPDNTGSPNTASAQNQHYLMQTGLFTTVSSLSASSLTLTGDFGYVAGVASGALINSSTSGSVSLAGLTLSGLKPSNANAYLLINSIDGTGTATPSLTVSNLRANGYGTGVTLPVAKSLFGSATGLNMTMNFSDIKLDARDGNTITDTNWTSSATAESAMNTAYGTSRSIFGTAIFFTTLLAGKTCNMEYNYAVEKDWGTGNPREVTYGKEVTDSKEYANGEKRYFLAGENDGHYTNPISDSDTEFSFATGFLPYVGNYTAKGTDATYPVNEIKVNYKAPGITEGCGTYNHPYIITTASQLNAVAKAINGTAYPSTIRLPNYRIADHVSISWHDSTINPKGCGIYNLDGDNYNKATSNSTNGLSNGSWTKTRVRYYLASAYYVINTDIDLSELTESFPGIGTPGSGTVVNGNFVFHGVILGKKNDGSAPKITNNTSNPFIYISNGSVVKNIDFEVTANVSKTLDRTGANALYGYKKNNSDDLGAEYYGGVIGEIMGGDNIIDDVTVTYTGSTTLSGTYKHIIAEGGMVGAVVNGALIFRGSDSVTGRTVTGGGIYSNPYVGRVINGYAIYESISGRSGSAPVNGTNYPIDTIDRSNTNKLDVNYTTGKIIVPDAQSLYIMSLITQSIASTANTSDNENYGSYSPSYGYNSYLYGVARLGDYGNVGCGTTATKPDDYASYAYRDSVNNLYTTTTDLVNSPTPYLIYKYTKAYGTDTITSKNYPARKMTSNNEKFWDITLSSSDTFAGFDSFQAFRGIGSVSINAKSATDTTAKTAFKVATFDGGNNTIKLHISLPRYERNQENYYHYQNKSLTQAYSGEELTSPYGHDENLHKLMGLGLFDCVMVSYDSTHEYQFKDFKLQGIIEDKVYAKNGDNKTGTSDDSQLFCVGGVVGKRINGNNSNLNFSSIIFDGLTITGAYSCGGLIGIDAIGKKGNQNDNNAKKSMKIDGCNSTANGISVTGGYYGINTDIRHGIGSFVGMTFWCRPYINGKTSTSNTSNISVSNVTTFYTGDKGCSVGGLIGYTGSGAEIKNINLVAANSSAVIGGEKVFNTGGFIGFTQAMTSETSSRTTPNANDLKDCVYIENCTIQNLPIKAKNGAAGFVSKTGNSDSWHTKYIYISGCAVIGNSENKPEIKAYGTGTSTQTNCVGGFVGDLRSSVVTCLIQNSYIENYTIEGWHVGGIIGETTYRSVNLKNLYVKDCDIVRNNSSSGAIGGIVGYSNQNINGYNLKIDGVIFKKKSSSGYTESPSDAGFILGANDKNDRIDKFVAISAYHTTVAKVPTAVIKTNGTNTGNFFVFADYMNTSAEDITAKAGYSSTFDNTNNVEQPFAPYVNVAPHISVGTNEYLTGDGASIGKAGEIYKDVKANTSNRKYAIGSTAITDSSVGNATDATTLAKYINNDGTYKDGTFKISTASSVFGTLPAGVTDFAMLVINNDSAKSSDITPFIKSYIRLVTNAEGSSNTNKNSQYAYSCGNTTIDALYTVDIHPCYYDESQSKFVLGTIGEQGLKMYSRSDTTASNQGKYYFDSTKADSTSQNKYQFSLIDVQFKDPTDTTGTKIAYHLYVPVYTQKMLSAEFSAVSVTSTPYYRSIYVNRIASELANNKNTNDRSILVESTDEWTTTFIRYTYPKNQISSGNNWNFDKSIILKLEESFYTLPIGTKLILLDPNANADKFYTLTLNSEIPKNTDYTLNLSAFTDESGTPFAPKALSAILADNSASSGNELYEDYYISMYVPKEYVPKENEDDPDMGKTHGILFSSGTEMFHTGGEEKANIESNLWSFVVLGDLFEHSIKSFSVNSKEGAAEMTADNNKLTTNVIATIKLHDHFAAPYLRDSDIAHAFYVTLTSHDAEHRVTDSIYGTNQNYIINSTAITYNDGEAHTIIISNDNEEHTPTISIDGGDPTSTISSAHLGPNYVELQTGNIKNALLSTSYPTVTISATTEMTFMDINAFPYNEERKPGIGTQVSIKSNIAYQEEDLQYSSMKKVEEDPAGTFYYVTTRNNAALNFSAVPSEDVADEIGLKTNNRSLLGINGKYSALSPIIGKSIYDANDIVNYESSTNIKYTISLYKKVTDVNGKTSYHQLSDISRYLQNITLTDSEVTLTKDMSNSTLAKYVYVGAIDHTNLKDQDKMFEADFSCNVITGDTGNREYANYKINMEVELIGASNTWKDSYIIYTNAKFDPSVIDAAN